MFKTVSIRSAGKADIRPLAQTLGAAFEQDPVWKWLLPRDRRRASGAPHFFAASARHHYIEIGTTDLAVHADGTIGGAALWAPPGLWHTPQRAELRMMPGVIRAFGRRINAGKLLNDTIKQHHPTEPHWYLSVIGTDPMTRGAGFGSALIQSRLAICDANNSPAYLESSNPDNIAYYERFGFEVTGKIVIPGGPTVIPMWRAARSA